jgi:lipid-A-disaccharide synthase-like uncharacterized protein
MRSLYFKLSSASFFITFLSPETATSSKMHVPFLLSQIMSGLLLGYYFLIIITIIIILVITFIQGIFTYVPETNHVSRVYHVAAILYL